MAVSPDDRFAGLISASAERGGWIPGDVFAADAQGEEEPVAARRTRLPVLVALGVLTAAVLVAAFLLFRPAAQHSAAGQPAGGQVPDGQSATAGAGGASPEAAASGETVGTGETAAAAPSGTVTVHVTGQVRDPGVVTLDAGSRVHDAVDAAGGLTGDAVAEAVNLARVLVDGEQIHIPEPGEEPGGAGAGAGGQADGAGAGGSGAAGPEGEASGTAAGDPGPKVDLNSADTTTLQTLPGVGPVTAEAIIAHRQTQPFTSIEDLLLVHGIGPKTYERLKDHVTVG